MKNLLILKCVNRKLYLSRILLSLLTVLITSCEQDYLKEDTKIENELGNEIKVVDGRMYFPSKEVFVETFKKYADESNDEIYSYVNKFYNNDFSSLRIPATQSNEEKVLERYQKRAQRLSTEFDLNRTEGDIYDDIDDLEEIIGDEAFSAFLNEQAEIQVGNTIYKYTDVGLFYATVDNFSVLDQYLEVKIFQKIY